jgi:uncharacterized protein (TIGR03083 family)
VSKPHGSKDFWLAGLRAEGAAFRGAIATAGDLDQRVPPCPDWSLLDLVHHLGNVYRFVHGHVGRGETTAPPRPEPERPPADQALAWWDATYQRLFTLLDGLDPALPATNWAPQPKKAEFWHRRMAHETAIHRWDAQSAVGLTEPVESKLAADGITEVLDTWLPAGKRKGPTDRRGIVALHATDTGTTWYVRLRGEGIALLDTDTLLDDDAHQHERAVAHGTASDLLLAIYGRVAFDILDITGDERLLPALRAG